MTVTAETLSVADAVLAILNAEDAEWSADFTAELAFVPKVVLDESNDVHVLVVAKTVEHSIAERDRNERIYSIDIGILKKVATPLVRTDIEPLIACAEEIVQAFLGERIATEDDAIETICMDARIEVLYDQEELEHRSTFSSLVNLKLQRLN